MTPMQASRSRLELRRHDGVTDLLAFHRRWPGRYPFLLESVARGTATASTNAGISTSARYDILFACPGESLILDAQGRLHGPDVAQARTDSGDFLAALDRWWQGEGEPAAVETGVGLGTGSDVEPESEPGSGPDPQYQCLLPFRGGWFVYLAYELAGQIEPSLRLPLAAADAPALPVACAVRVPAAIICDHELGATWLVAEPEHATCLQQLEQDLAELGRAQGSAESATDGATGEEASLLLPVPAQAVALEEAPGEQFTRAVERIKRYITEGDVFQVNLSRLWHTALPAGTDIDALASALYARLRRVNPAPFAGLARLPGGSIVSSSPERLVRVQGDRVETRPIAGTRPRGRDAAGDAGLSAELLAHPKERAEHIMLIDLERNDLGRLCRPGTVEVDELMVLESYAHVHHIVSNVRGRLRAGWTPGEVIRAVFPGGTITGCPKVRCMAIIAELEAEARGAYTGSMGYLNRDGSLDLNILIRTLSVCTGALSLRAGAGIVADSEPGHELAETRAKARGLLLALESDA